MKNYITGRVTGVSNTGMWDVAARRRRKGMDVASPPSGTEAR